MCILPAAFIPVANVDSSGHLPGPLPLTVIELTPVAGLSIFRRSRSRDKYTVWQNLGMIIWGAVLFSRAG